MKKIVLILVLFIALSSCNAPKGILTSKTNRVETHQKTSTSNPILSIESNNFELTPVDLTPIGLNIKSELPKTIDTKANRIVDYAFAFDGVRYKRGGTTKDGMDCSGLVVTTFDSENISLPRVSRDMARMGTSIKLQEVSKGDLLFFATRKNSKTISHVGIVTTARDGYVEFIHASTKNGVIVSNMAEKYWYFAFVQARRVI
ncbi:C40 family peptidase [Gelidibacter sp. F63206]|uniref:C40 family peptidase n=1 Tax=Gelidibacter sp. F63206 TaxID=2926425 RepID=UPI001FF12068|nr:NlpC/P60 family protein [Gelidibacter sp. F63206]MCK0114552.1 NlpC/P60 family protein [Gelidibacter sp. F63206]